MGMPRQLRTVVAVLVVAPLGLAGMPPSEAATQPGWRIVFSHHYPLSNRADSAYGAVVAPGRNDAWALGGSQWGSNGGYPAAVHWNGRRWRAAALPAGLHGYISAASASSAGNIWATSVFNGYVLRWNGSRWRVARRWKETSYPSDLTGVTAISRTDVWVFGGVIVGLTSQPGFGTWHYNGRTWTKIRGQGRNIVQASALSASDIWGIGGYYAAYAQVDHYNGKTWRAVPFPAWLGNPQYIFAAGPRDVWLAGENAPGSQFLPVLGRWNGRTWHRVALPAPAASAASAIGPISADGHGGIWVDEQDTQRIRPLLLHRSASGAWTISTLRPASIAGAPVLIPGTTSMWDACTYSTTDGGIAAIWAYGPVG